MSMKAQIYLYNTCFTIKYFKEIMESESNGN